MGIRTPDTLLTYTRFPIVRLRPTRPSLRIGSFQRQSLFYTMKTYLSTHSNIGLEKRVLIIELISTVAIMLLYKRILLIIEINIFFKLTKLKNCIKRYTFFRTVNTFVQLLHIAKRRNRYGWKIFLGHNIHERQVYI